MPTTIEFDIIDLSKKPGSPFELFAALVSLLTHTIGKPTTKSERNKTTGDILTKQPKVRRDGLGRFIPKYGVPCEATLKRKARRQRARARELAAKSHVCSCGGACRTK